MIYEDAMKYITEVGNFGSNYGLDRTYRLLEILGDPQKELKVIHIAGTNGKGSTTAMITEMLKGGGYKVGMYTSPFLEDFEERIQINGENISKETLAKLIEEVKIAVDKVIDEGYNHPTEFEIITVLMLLHFKRQEVDFAVVEVGLGGRLDSTNVVNPILSIITSISFDHMNLLGNTLAAIASEKAGIIKNNIPTLIYPQEKEAMEVIEKKCRETNSKLYEINEESIELLNIEKGNRPYQEIKVKGNNEYIVKLPLLGEHQILNLAVAIRAIEILNGNGYEEISREIIENSIEKVKWKGRLEVIKTNPLVVIDGAHNIQGISKLRTNIEKYFNYQDLYLILGILADKDVETMVKTIVPMAKKVYAVTPNSNRAELALDLKKEIIKHNSNCEAFESYEEAYLKAKADSTNVDLILASGSLYMIGDMRKIITRKYK